MNEKQNEIMKYLERTRWSPVELLEKKFDVDRSEITEVLNCMTVRIDRDIVHVS